MSKDDNLESAAIAHIKTVFMGGDAEQEEKSWYDEIPLIEDLLAWQEMIDNGRGGINMRGSARFWKTVKAHGIHMQSRDGAPEFSEIVFDLGNGIGMMLYTEVIHENTFDPGWEKWCPTINFRFVKLDED